jgi:hypothetical protein
MEQMEKEVDRTAEIEARVAKADQEAAVAELAAEKDAELKAGSEEHTKEHRAAEEECNSKLQALKKGRCDRIASRSRFGLHE